MRLTDEELYLDYCREMELTVPPPGRLRDIVVGWVSEIRQREPRMNSGIHLCDYLNIFDEDDLESGLEGYYGPGYFDE